MFETLTGCSAAAMMSLRLVFSRISKTNGLFFSCVAKFIVSSNTRENAKLSFGLRIFFLSLLQMEIKIEINRDAFNFFR